MNLNHITLDSDTHNTVFAYLRSAPERIAFMATRRDSPVVIDWLPMLEPDVQLKSRHAELSTEAKSRFFVWASESDGAIIEAHSHLGRAGDPARFSDLDLRSLRDWVPHARWRLRWRPYAALVAGPTTFDALYWEGCKEAVGRQLQSLIVPGHRLYGATGLSLRYGGHHHE